MGLRCSLLGHAYDDSEVERERDDRGDEVVVTVREIRTCRRCGADDVVSENTEVRPVEPMPDEADDADEETPASESSADDEFEPPASPEEDDAVILEDDAGGADDADDAAASTADRDPGEWPEAEDTRVDEPTPEAEAAAADETAADADDGTEADAETEIIEAEDDPAPSEGVAGDEDGGWPDPGPSAEDEGFDATPGSAEGDVEMGGLTPEGVASAEDADDGGAVVGGEREGFGTGIESSGSAAVEGSDDVDVDAEFVCPACDYTESVLDSSLREGDICPECRRGYLAERSPTRN